MAIAQLRKALDAFARLDVDKAVEVLKQDDQIDQEFEGLMRKLITYMMEDPRTISASIDLVFVAKAIERVGDHAKNLAEVIIYIVKGTDVRHNPVATVEDWCADGVQGSNMSRILVVEDESAIAELISINLRHAGYEVTIAADAEQAQAEVDGVLPDWWCWTGCCPGNRAWRWRSAGAASRARASCRSSC